MGSLGFGSVYRLSYVSGRDGGPLLRHHKAQHLKGSGVESGVDWTDFDVGTRSVRAPVTGLLHVGLDAESKTEVLWVGFCFRYPQKGRRSNHTLETYTGRH